MRIAWRHEPGVGGITRRFASRGTMAGRTCPWRPPAPLRRSRIRRFHRRDGAWIGPPCEHPLWGTALTGRRICPSTPLSTFDLPFAVWLSLSLGLHLVVRPKRHAIRCERWVPTSSLLCFVTGDPRPDQVSPRINHSWAKKAESAPPTGGSVVGERLGMAYTKTLAPLKS